MKKTLTLSAIALCFAASSASANDMRMPKGNVDHFFNQMDANKNGVITRRENEVFANDMFNQADMNNDNIVTREEFMAHKRLYHKDWKHDGKPMCSGHYERDGNYNNRVYNNDSRNYDSDLIDDSMDPKKYNSRRTDRVYNAEDDNGNY
jgi:hypothetical protein